MFDRLSFHVRYGIKSPQNGIGRSLFEGSHAKWSDIQRILTDNFMMGSICAGWMPHLLTIEQKQRHENVSIECLAMFNYSKA